MNINVSLNLISACTLSFIVFRESEEFKFQMNRIYKRLSITISGEKLKRKERGGRRKEIENYLQILGTGLKTCRFPTTLKLI